MQKELPKAYEPQQYEDEIYKCWEESGFFAPQVHPSWADNPGTREPYAIMMPPPNVTGVLHLGHALENSLMDVMARFQRMRGKKVLLLPGTDHAAVATQARVEKNLIEAGMKHPREEFGRDGLLEKIREYAEQSKATILAQIKKMGTSCDWSRLAYTFDEDRSIAVNMVFKKMYDDGLIYRGYRVVNWSVKGQSTCSDDELVYVDRKAKMYTFKYSKDFPFTIATTRPETKLGDTAVAVNPNDERYKKYIGQIFEVQFCGVDLKLKVIGDDHVDMTFGTGALGVTPAHSPVDFDMYERKKSEGDAIDLIQVIGEDGKMTVQAGKDFAGLAVEEAREKVVEQLKADGLFVSEEEIDQNVGTSDRFGDIVEALPMKQWWLDVQKEIPSKGKSLRDLMKESLTIGLDGDLDKKVTITPKRFTKLYLDRVDNLRDWCLSRQIWWGHRIPVWYKSKVESQKSKDFILNFRNREMFDLIKNEEKTVETRALNPEERKRYFGDINIGDILVLKHLENNNVVEELRVIVKRVEIYKNTEAMLEKENIDKIWPNKSINELLEFQKNIPEYSEKINKNGIIAFEIKVLKNYNNEIYVGLEAPEGEGWEQDPDTLDTWFSSGLWTFSTLGWPQEEKFEQMKEFYPTAWMQMGYEILYLWLMRMVLMSAYNLGEAPFKDVYIHGMLRDKDGQKFSKSAKNGIDPLDVIERYGTDALRFSLLSGISPGNDARFYLEKVEGSRNLVNKLWNVCRFSLTIISGIDLEQTSRKWTDSDEWILSKFNTLVAGVTIDLETYNFSQAAEKLREFTWSDLADWYLEVAKFEQSKEKDAVLSYILPNLLKLWHPFMPFVTEELWKVMRITDVSELLMSAQWPVIGGNIFETSEAKFELVKNIITQIRSLRAENKIEPAKKLSVTISAGDKKKLLEENIDVIKGLARLESVTIEEKTEKPINSIGFVESGVDVYISLEGVADFEKETQRLTGEIDELKKYIFVLEKKLSNQEFVNNAPTEVVAKEQEKLVVSQEKLEKLEGQFSQLI